LPKLDLKLYRGYVNENELVIFGHIFKSWAPDKYSLDRRGIKHAVSIIHMFRIKPLKNFEVRLKFKNLDVVTKTMDDGYFKFCVPFNEPLESGWHDYEVSVKVFDFGIINRGELLKPFESKVAIISDIDDTFLVSHSNNIFKKLYVMLLKNINKRKIYDDVVDHYKYLSEGNDNNNEQSNSFFYVSSSEWNLYEFIENFAQKHELPKAVIMLRKIKTGITDFLSSGRGNHDHKFAKIKEIISFYPNLQYVLLGDDSQQDPYIYERICKTFPKNLKAVYIRQTTKHKKRDIKTVLKNLESLNVPTCYFKHSNKAIEHSRKLGID